MIKPEIGKYYADENCIIKVVELDHLQQPLGVLVWKTERSVSIDHFIDVHYVFYENNKDLKEITKEEFETKFQEYQTKMNELFNELLNNDENSN